MYSAVKLDPEAGGVESGSLGICIEDMSLHYMREGICCTTQLDPDGKLHVVRRPWTGYLRCKPWMHCGIINQNSCVLVAQLEGSIFSTKPESSCSSRGC